MLDGTIVTSDAFFFAILGLVLLGVAAMCMYSKKLSKSKRVSQLESSEESYDVTTLDES